MGGRTEGELIWWVPDTCTDLPACAMHEVGHMLGLQHVPYAGQVMSARTRRTYSAPRTTTNACASASAAIARRLHHGHRDGGPEHAQPEPGYPP